MQLLTYQEYLKLNDLDKNDEHFLIVDTTVDAYYHEPSYPPIRYRSTCAYCGAPINDEGKCEYCGVGHQYLD